MKIKGLDDEWDRDLGWHRSHVLLLFVSWNKLKNNELVWILFRLQGLTVKLIDVSYTNDPLQALTVGILSYGSQVIYYMSSVVTQYRRWASQLLRVRVRLKVSFWAVLRR